MLAISGVTDLVGNAQVDSEIQRRRTTLPVALPGGAEATVDLYFPIAPQSGRTQIVYVDRHGEHRLDIDTRQARVELERPPTLVFRADPDFPDLARRTRVDEGYVKALLTLDRHGRVQGVDVIESVPLGMFNQEARRTFGRWKYSAGYFDGRTVEATLEFKR